MLLLEADWSIEEEDLYIHLVITTQQKKPGLPPKLFR